MNIFNPMANDLFTILSIFSFALGACIASFLNVVIWRVPRGESIVSPPSHCPKCGKLIRWWQNIPILAWLALRGRCANCREPISPRYILIETLGGLLFWAAFAHIAHGGAPLWMVPIWWVWISLMIIGSFIDFDHQLLPDFVTVGGMVIGVATHGAISWMVHSFQPLIFSLFGLVFGFGLLALIRFLGGKIFHREAMGMGDVFLMGAIGALFGPIAVLVTLILSSFIGSLVGFAMIAFSRIRLGRFVAIPYGPYICLGCLVWMFAGLQIVEWYLGLIGMQ